MKLIGQVNNPRMAQAFADYMINAGIECQIQYNESLYNIAVQPDNEVKAQLEFIQFIKDPTNNRYRSASWDRIDNNSAQFNYGSCWQDLVRGIFTQAGVLTIGVLLICVSIWIICSLGFYSNLFATLHFPSDSIQFLQIWRYFSPAFMHFDLIHLVFNILWWWYLGGKIELERGRFQLLLITFWGSLIPNSLQGFMEDHHFIGLSGVVYSLIGYVFIVQRNLAKPTLPNSIITLMIIWIGLGFTGLTGIDMANWAHLAGLIVGCALGFLAPKQKSPVKTRLWG